MMNYKNTKEINGFLNNTTLQQEKIYNAVYDEFKSLTKVTFEAQMRKGICSKILYKAKHNLEDTSKLRDTLYENCKLNYNTLKNYKLKQIHFHTNEGKSFLRMNKPNIFGDDLKITRPMISKIIETKKFISGYEEGRYSGGYRYIYPIFHNNEYVGNIEYVFSSLIISKRFMDNYGGSGNFLIKEKILDKFSLSPKEKGYAKSHLEGYYIEKQFFEIVKQRPLSTSTLKYINKKLDEKDKFSLYDKPIDKVVTVFKIKDQLQNNIEGLFIIRSDSSFIYNKNRNFIFMFSILSFFIFVIHYFLYLHFKSKLLLEIKIEKAVIEARHKDKILQKKEKSAAMGEMIDSIAHQWKQPVGVIKMCLDMILLDISRGNLDKEYIIKNIQTSILQVDHLTSTIDEFRNFFKPDKKIESITIKEIIDSSMLLVKDELIKNTISCDAHIKDDLSVNINKNEFIHVILNLLNNAKDAFNENGIKNRTINLTAYKKDSKTILEICDNAGGIPESIIGKIFDSRFTTKEHIQGTGIGLYMSKQIIEKYNGKIEASNNGKNGTCFKILF